MVNPGVYTALRPSFYRLPSSSSAAEDRGRPDGASNTQAGDSRASPPQLAARSPHEPATPSNLSGSLEVAMSSLLKSAASVVGALVLAALAGPMAVARETADTASPATWADPFPNVIHLPNGWGPEGIATGRGTTFYAASTQGGAIYAGDLRTGTGAMLVPPVSGHDSLGLKVDRHNRLFVAGIFGQAYVYDARTGQSLATFDLAPFGEALVNDVIVTEDAAYFTDSFNPRLFVLPIARNGALGVPYELPLGGDFVNDPDGFNANGIAATPDGRQLIINQTSARKLFRVDPRTGVAREIRIDGDPGTGDGILLRGRTLYQATGFENEVRVMGLDPDLKHGRLIDVITDPRFDVPTTLAGFGRRIYVVNARFDIEPGPDVTYDILQLPRP
jgi:sugar lactone lactonase YvrE